MTVKTPADNRKTIEEQMHGIPETVVEQDILDRIAPPPKQKCIVPHSQLESGQRCKTCGMQKF